MGLALLLVISLITIVSSYFFIAHTWWMQPLASLNGGIDRQFNLTFVLMGIVFIAAQLGLALFVWKYRDRGDKNKGAVQYSHGNTRLEVIWTTMTAVMFIGLVLAGTKIWAANRFEPAKSGAVPVEVTGLQFQWYFRYPGPDGKYGRTRPELIDPSMGGAGAVGLDSDDPASKDDVVTNTMYLPVGREVDLSLRAEDVIHSFFVPAMRFKQDAVPGLMIHMHFTPDKIGEYEIACAELCGLGHYRMHGVLRVVSQADFDKWLAEREAEKQ
ncbi:MAG: cytochrome c oxidase subunit II [Terriglobales bacterium]